MKNSHLNMDGDPWIHGLHAEFTSDASLLNLEHVILLRQIILTAWFGSDLRVSGAHALLHY